MTSSAPTSRDIPERFRTARGTLWLDRVMTWVIQLGGVLVITAVLGIFLFILWQVFPLFQQARVQEVASVALPQSRYAAVGMDEWGRLPVLVEPDGTLLFVDVEARRVFEKKVVYPGEGGPPDVTAASWNKREGRVILGTAAGRFFLVDPRFTSTGAGREQKVIADPVAEPSRPLGQPGLPILDIQYGDSRRGKLVAALQSDGEANYLSAALYRRKRTLVGTGPEERVGEFDLTPLVRGRPEKILVPATGDAVVAVLDGGRVAYLALNDAGQFELLQEFRPFEDLEDPRITAAGFIFGDVSIAFGSESGENRIFSLFYPDGGSRRVFGLTQRFPPLGASPTFIASTLRNKAFLIGGGRRVSLRFRTTESVRWNAELPFRARAAAFNGKYTRFVLLDEEARLHVFQLDDPHPDSGWKALFGKIWYEGAPGPRWTWQSTGGSDDFEPKYSLVPLLFGTIKGTVYAMLFSVPIALLAAIYTSQFLDARLRRVVKPAMEIMASLPSVVLGFLAALYIAPLVERQVPSLLLVAAGIPLLAALLGWVWSLQPVQVRRAIPEGWEWLAFAPVLAVAAWALWSLGPVFERLAFVATDPATGRPMADFRYWWPQATGASFDQRNSMVVGFMMGFAVIPIIFTISEDALSNVPASLRTASLACGASRWQTARWVVLPTASPGIFSALMVGLGRAVGETMIVVMATGNTPIMEWNIFSGMRTLSANIAVELPEAPHNSTLYRTLFFGALLLFALTFVVNTVAEVLRQHLREKFKTV